MIKILLSFILICVIILFFGSLVRNWLECPAATKLQTLKRILVGLVVAGISATLLFFVVQIF